MAERITGKVARVNSDRELIINRGSAHGVERGMYFFVKADPIDISDPDTGESIGSVSPVKVVVRADEVDEKFCIARTFRTKKVLVRPAQEGNEIFAMQAWRRQLQPPRPAEYETRVETLRLDPKKGSPITETESVVGIGDLVESVLDGEALDPATTTLFD